MLRQAIAAVVVLAVSGMPCWAQSGGEAFRDYPVMQGSAQELEMQLQSQLNQLGVPGRIMSDPERNRILVQGGENVHRFVQQYMGLPVSQSAASMQSSQSAVSFPTAQSRLAPSTNYPPQQAPVAQANGSGNASLQISNSGQSGLLTKTYNVAPEILDACAQQIRTHFAQSTQVRVATVVETSTLIVAAPAELHGQIAEQVTAVMANPNPHRVIQGGLVANPEQQVNTQQTKWDLRAPDHTQRYQQYAEQARQFDNGAARPQARAASGPTINQSHQYVPSNGEVLPKTLGHLAFQTDQGLGVSLHTDPRVLIGVLRQGLGDQFSQHPFVGVENGAIFTLHLGEAYGTVRLDWNLDSNKVIVRGYPQMQERMARLLAALDDPQALQNGEIQFTSLGAASPKTVMQLVQAVQRDQSGRQAGPSNYMVGNLFYRRQPQDGAPAPQNAQPQPVQQQPGNQSLLQPTPLAGANPQRPVRAEVIEGIGIVLTGTDQDLEQLRVLIDQIIEESELSEPLVESYTLRHVDSVTLADAVQSIYDQTYAVRRGPVTITPFVNPNSLLIIGQEGAVEQAKDLIRRLDQRGSPGAQFQVFPLQHASAVTVQGAIQQLYPGGGTAALEPQVVVIAADRSNTLIVRASQRDLLEVESLISKLDVGDTALDLEMQIFKLENSDATTLLDVLQQVIVGGQAAGGGGQFGGGGFGGQQQQAGATPASIVIRQYDMQTNQIVDEIRSGILSNVRITVDPRGNALVVAAPTDAMPLIAKLIETLDSIPGAEAQIKVFPVLNGDAAALVDMLRTLFGQQTTQGGGFGGQQQDVVGSPTGEGIVPLRFAVEARTNSVIAAGTANDLQIVESILLSLDADDVADRQTDVVRLKNVPAVDIANAITSILQTEADLLGDQNAFQLLQQQVVVVPESITNTLIITSTNRYYDQIMDIIETLDRDPPMVMIQVLIAEVGLNNTDEFGVELGLQDSILFDRSLLGDLVTTTNSVQTNNGGAVITDTQQIIQGASLTPGFLFGNPTTPLPNSGSDLSRSTAGSLGGQGLTSFSVGRINNDLGYGGLVLSASSESISFLLRALQESRRLDVISRPQIQTLDNQPAFVQVGQRVQLPTGSNFDTATGITQVTVGAPENVGIILGVVPRISLGKLDTLADDQVVMQIDVEKSEVGPESEGIPLSVNAQGDVLRSPRINTVTAQTTVSGVDGQTIVLGGLITKSETKVHRRVPVLASIPVLGHLFRYDLKSIRKTELMIILTPRIVRTPEEAEYLKRVESARMSWVLSDVNNMHGGDGLYSRYEPFGEPAMVVYPDLNPDGFLPTEGVPTPMDGPMHQPMHGMDPNQMGPGGMGSGNMQPGLAPAPNPPQDNFLQFNGNDGGVQQTGYSARGGQFNQGQFQQGQPYQSQYRGAFNGQTNYLGAPKLPAQSRPMEGMNYDTRYAPQQYNPQFYQQPGPQPPPGRQAPGRRAPTGQVPQYQFPPSR